ncbi:MAG: hypothetical protein WCI47_02640 [bacterium]
MKRHHGFIIASIGICLIVVAVLSYRDNRIQAYAQVTKIIELDNQAKDTTNEISVLKQRVSKHMNSSVKFSLEAKYERDSKAAKLAIVQLPFINIDVYKEGAASCQPKSDSITQAKCIAAYVDSHPDKVKPQSVPPKLPNKADYSYDLQSPRWTWDTSGILGLTGLAVTLIGVSLFAIAHTQSKIKALPKIGSSSTKPQ